MSRYINADRLKEEIDEWLDSVGTALVGKGLSYYAELIGCIEDCPTVDAVEVVRCRDCKHSRDEKQPHYCEVWRRHKIVGGNGFCSYGERKVQE